MISRNCLRCNKTFYTWFAEIKKGGGKYCSIICTRASIKGSIRAKRLEIICPNCSKTFLTRQSRINQGRGRYCSRICASIYTSKNRKLSDDTRKKLSKIRIGKLNPAYKHGNSKNAKRYKGTFPRLIKEKVIKRDNFSCQICFSKNNLVVHHIDLNFFNASLKNLITWCRSCHSKWHRNYEYSHNLRKPPRNQKWN